MYSDIFSILPEIILAIGAMLLLMIGVFKKDGESSVVGILSLGLIIITGMFVYMQPSEPQVAFNDSFTIDAFARFLKILVLLGSFVVIYMSNEYIQEARLRYFEFPILILLATVGMMLMISASDMMGLYLGLELQSLSLYVLASFHRRSIKSSEAGLKYFVLGALSSGMLLYGISLVYGMTGSTHYSVIATVLKAGDVNIGLIIGLVFIMAAMAFKISAAPFHMWTPDVYEGAPTPVTAFFAGAPKVAAMALLMRLIFEAFPHITNHWRQILVFMSLVSMVLGAFAAIGQTNIKRLVAYSSIANMGAILVGLVAGTQFGISSVLIYLTIYLITTLGLFACILAMKREGEMVEDISQLAGLSKNNLLMASLMGIFFLSLAGIPPFAGFWAKFYVFSAVIDTARGDAAGVAHPGLYWFAAIGIVSTVVGAFYYLRMVKIMFFDEAVIDTLDPMHGKLQFIAVLAGIFTIFFIFFPDPLISSAQIAAASFFR